MSKRRILVLMHEDLVPPSTLEGLSEDKATLYKTEFDVVQGLNSLGHEVRPLGVSSDLGVVRDAIVEWKPHVAFNLLEEFHGVAVYDQHVASYLELMRQPYTGCNPRGLMLAHDKTLAKKILSYHRIAVPDFVLYPRGKKVRRPRRLEFPLLVKCATEEASYGIAQASVVTSDEKLQDRVAYVHDQLGCDALVEEYIDGRELYVGIMGNRRVHTFPTWEIYFGSMGENVPKIATAKVKWDSKYQHKHDIVSTLASELPPGVEAQLARLSKRIYRTLGMSGYARMDFRLRPDGTPFVLEANPNPNLADDEDFAASADYLGIDYPSLLQRIVNLGLQYQAEWKLT